MPVAIKHLGEIHQVLNKYMRPNLVARMLEDMRRTEAYRSNQSFRVTVDLLAQSGPLRQPDANEVIFGDDD